MRTLATLPICIKTLATCRCPGTGALLGDPMFKTPSPKLKVEYRPLDALIPAARNPRTHSDDQVAQIAPHALDGLLGAMAGLILLVFSTDGANVRDVPDGALLSIASPVTRAAFPHRIPAWLVLPMIISTSDDDSPLPPNQLRSDLEIDRLKRGASAL